MQSLKDVMIHIAPKPVKISMALRSDMSFRTHELLSLSRDVLVISALSLSTPYREIQNFIFENNKSSFGVHEKASPIMVSLSNNPNLSEDVRVKLLKIPEKIDESQLYFFVKIEFELMNYILNQNLQSHPSYSGGLGFTSIIASSKNISPSLHQAIIKMAMEFSKRKNTHIYKYSNNGSNNELGKSPSKKNTTYSYSARNLLRLIEALNSNPELNPYSKERLAILTEHVLSLLENTKHNSFFPGKL